MDIHVISQPTGQRKAAPTIACNWEGNKVSSRCEIDFDLICLATALHCWAPLHVDDYVLMTMGDIYLEIESLGPVGHLFTIRQPRNDGNLHQ